jgi:hypothetical protein
MYSHLNQIKIIILVLIFLGGLYFYIQYGNKPQFLEGLTTTNGEVRCPNILIQKGAKYFLYNSNIDEVPGVNPIMFNNLDEYTQFVEWQHNAGIRCPVLYVQNTYDAQGNRVYKMRPSICEPQGGLPPSATSPSNSGSTSPSGETTTGVSGATTSATTTSGSKTSESSGTSTNTGFTGSDTGSIDSANYNSKDPANVRILGDGFIPLVDASRSDHPYNTNSYPGFDQSDYYVGYITPLDKIANNDALLYNSGGTTDVSDSPMDPNWGGQNYTQNLVDKGYYNYK